MPELSPCPCCGKTKYKYAFSLFQLIAESADPALALFMAKKRIPALISKVWKSKGAGLGIFSVPLCAYQGIISGLDGNPLLRCKNCQNYVIKCNACNVYTVVERYPGTAELIQCSQCHARFQPCESSDEFDNLISGN